MLIFIGKALLLTAALLNAAMTALLVCVSFDEQIKTARARFLALCFAFMCWGCFGAFFLL